MVVCNSVQVFQNYRSNVQLIWMYIYCFNIHVYIGANFKTQVVVMLWHPYCWPTEWLLLGACHWGISQVVWCCYCLSSDWDLNQDLWSFWLCCLLAELSGKWCGVVSNIWSHLESEKYEMMDLSHGTLFCCWYQSHCLELIIGILQSSKLLDLEKYIYVGDMNNSYSCLLIITSYTCANQGTWLKFLDIHIDIHLHTVSFVIEMYLTTNLWNRYS